MTPINATLQKWPLSSRIFHWISALLLLVTWILMLLYDQSESKFYIGLHKAFGMSLLFWMIARVINRVLTQSPRDVVMPKWQQLAAHFTHFALYALLIAMPIAGFLMSAYGGRPVDMFGLFEIPTFVAPDRKAARFYNDLHTDIIWPLIIVFTILHIAGALYHQFVQKDNVMGRIK